MKAALMVLIPVMAALSGYAAHAQQSDGAMAARITANCAILGRMAEVAAQNRDSDVPPEMVVPLLARFEEGQDVQVDPKFVINQIYFNKDFAGVPPRFIREVITDVCVRGTQRKYFKPLK